MLVRLVTFCCFVSKLGLRLVSHFPLHIRFLRLKFFLLLWTWEELSIVEDKRSPDRWGWEAAVVSHRERNIVWNYCLLYLDCSSMTVWDLNDWQMMSSKTNRVMTKQAATGNNIGLVGDFRHGNNQLQTTENCYIETLRTSDNSDNWDAIFTDLHTVLWSVWPKRIIKLSAKWFLTQHVYLRLKSRLQDIPLLIYQMYFYGPPLLNTHFGPYFIIY